MEEQICLRLQALHSRSLSLCRLLGLDEARLVDIINDSSAGPNVLKNRPQVVAKALSGEQVPGTFDIDGMRKDLKVMLDEAEGLGADLPITKAARLLGGKHRRRPWRTGWCPAIRLLA